MEKKGIIDWLKALKFSPEGGKVWRRHWGKCKITAELPEGEKKGKILYGKPIRHGGGDGEFSRGFEQGENLVALECICRLLDKGYKPEHLILEKQWRIGSTPKGGRADIVVREPDPESSDGESTLLIIECKTWGTEYENEIRRMERNGGQLFSYLQQTTDARYLCLYCSHVGGDSAAYENAIVKIADRPEDEEAAKKDESVLLYKNASTVEQRHEVWKKNFNLYFHYNGIFEDDVNAYKVELTPLKRRNLIPLGDAQGLFNRFSEILRHNNISDNANAFNRVLSLILCKIVDEEKGDDEVLGFQIREGEDTPEKVQDRLQMLYKEGMSRHLGEDIVYYSDEDIERLIGRYPERAPLDAVANMFREIKYYTKNEFAFKEVHNKALFEQNARVLGEVVKMLQNYRFRDAKKQQLLGDFFELLLNHGVKQSQGQFFTPLPVVQFIIRSVGVGRTARRWLDEGRGDFLPRVIDYACGAGHFLTECMENIRQTLVAVDEKTLPPKLKKQVSRCKESTEWTRGRIFGVEKDYRLARTAQIACFLNGDGEAEIIHGDGLEEHSRFGKKKFDILVANPPYSVKAFANYLESGAKKFRLAKKLSGNTGKIEVLFVERAAQLLVPGGAAGIILPATILSNKGVHANARELLLENFEIRAVAEMGGETFIATDTKTVILFLRRRRDAFMIDRARIADDCFYPHRTRGDLPDYIDNKKLLDKYARRRGLSSALYRDIVGGNPSAAAKKTSLFKNARRVFESSSVAKKFKESAVYLNMKEAERKREWECRFRECLLEMEREKFYFFMLCLNDDGGGAAEKPDCYDSQLVAAARSSDDKDQQRHFLGYESSDRRGKEGLKHFEEQAKGGLMYDPSDDDNLERVSAHLLRRMWNEPPAAIPPSLKEHVKVVRLTDCIDFEADNFDLAINLRAADDKAEEIKSQWPLAPLGDCADLIRGVTYDKRDQRNGETANVVLTADNITLDGELEIVKKIYLRDSLKMDAERKLRAGDVFICMASGERHVGKVAYIAEDSGFYAGGFMGILRAKSGMMSEYLFHALNYPKTRQALRNMSRGSSIQNLSNGIYNLKIVVPPLGVQKKIAARCTAIDGDSKSAKEEIVRLRDEINGIIGGAKERRALGDCAELIRGVTYDKRDQRNRETDKVVLTADNITLGGELEIVKKIYLRSELSLNDKCKLQAGDIFISMASGSKKHIGKCAYVASDVDFYAGGFMGILRAKGDMVGEYLFYAVNRPETRQAMRDMSQGSNIQNIGKTIGDLSIIVPSPAKQKQILTRLRPLIDGIAAARQRIKSAPVRKAEVMEREL